MAGSDSNGALERVLDKFDMSSAAMLELDHAASTSGETAAAFRRAGDVSRWRKSLTRGRDDLDGKRGIERLMVGRIATHALVAMSTEIAN
jgi:hypothetical protein